jgi:hypothetical protein
MNIEIDQSNKIEQTSKNTIIGLSNTKTFTILVEGKVKRRLQEEFRKQGKPRLFVYRTFIASVVLLLKYAELNNLIKVTIDKEYFGKEKILKSMFLEMWCRYFDQIPEISFEQIGKKSNAHNISYLTMKGKYKPDKILDFDDIKRLVLK